MTEAQLIVLCVLAPFATAFVAPLVVALLGHRAGWFLALLPASISYHFWTLSDRVAAGEKILVSQSWLPQLGVDFSFYVDGLSGLFVLLISGIGTFIVIYSAGYLKGHIHLGRFLGFILAFMGSMLGLVLADNIITLFIFWELTSITSFLLIGFDHTRMASRRAALQALFITGLGGLVMLAGLILMGGVGGSYALSDLTARGDMLRASDLYVAMLLLVLAGCFTKSAQVPFHSWLANAMEAPTPVSAYLHSATMVKAGVYLLMRLNPALGATDLWFLLLGGFGAATLIAGTLLAIRQTDLKLMLAYTTVASLGLLVMLTGIGTDTALKAAVLYLFAHSLFKGALFMIAGCVDHETGTRDLWKLGGLRSAMPITAAAAALAALSMAGLPPFVGFLAKEVIYEGVAKSEMLLLAMAFLGNAMMMAVGGAVALFPFWGAKVATPHKAHEGPPSLWLGPVVLSALGLALAVEPTFLGEHLIAPMVASLAGRPVVFELKLWHGVNQALILSIATIALGAVMIFAYRPFQRAVQGVFDAIGWGPDRGFDQLISGLTGFSQAVTGIFQTGRMQTYMRFALVMIAAALLWPVGQYAGLNLAIDWGALRFYEWAVLALGVIGVILVVITKQRLTAVLALGVQGFAVGLVFMLFGAPDLSFTQFMVETLAVVILALVLTRLNLDERDSRSWPDRIFDGGLALAIGAGFCVLLVRVTANPLDMRLSDFFARFSLPEAHGSNVVNVIIVDFRGLDTLGEISVVLIAAVATRALIRLTAPKITSAGKKLAKRRSSTATQPQLEGAQP